LENTYRGHDAQLAAEEARQKKLAEEQAMLDGRLWEFLELNDESSLITVDDAKQVNNRRLGIVIL
jgi:hypothetical protein